MRKVRLLFAGLAMLLLSVGVAGCGSTMYTAIGTWNDQDQSGVELTFTEEGQITGTDGCNQFSGSWEQHGDKVTLYKLVATAKDCQGQESWLVSPSSAEVDGDTMTIKNESGKDIGTLERS